jgi:hypothetical protein
MNGMPSTGRYWNKCNADLKNMKYHNSGIYTGAFHCPARSATIIPGTARIYIQKFILAIQKLT